MKRIYTFLTCVLIAFVSFSFTSCDDDSDQEAAATLNGTWHGVMGGNYYSRVYGYAYMEWETEFRFYVNGFTNGYGDYTNATSGSGMQVDYNPRLTGMYRAYSFQWNVVGGRIYLNYADGDSYVLEDYTLSDNLLSGILTDRYGNDVGQISLNRTSYWPWSDGYAKKQAYNTSSGIDTTSVKGR